MFSREKCGSEKSINPFSVSVSFHLFIETSSSSPRKKKVKKFVGASLSTEILKGSAVTEARALRPAREPWAEELRAWLGLEALPPGAGS